MVCGHRSMVTTKPPKMPAFEGLSSERCPHERKREIIHDRYVVKSGKPRKRMGRSLARLKVRNYLVIDYIPQTVRQPLLRFSQVRQNSYFNLEPHPEADLRLSDIAISQDARSILRALQVLCDTQLSAWSCD